MIERTRAAGILARVVELEQAGRPFALATVVAVARPTSAKPGSRGIVHPDGTIEGWVGGSCAQPTIVAEGLRAIADGEPRLVRISKDGGGGSSSRRGDGIVDVVMACASGGTLEIFVEPRLPAAQLWVVGSTPIARALAEVGAAAGWQVTAVDPAATREAFPAASRIHPARELASLSSVVPPYVVVASQGQWDEEALEAALARDVAYVGLVASQRRAAAVQEYLELAGIPPERRGAVRAPCGLDVGAATAGEVAVSILAELVQVRRGRAPFVAMPGPALLAGAAGGSGGTPAGGAGAAGASSASTAAGATGATGTAGGADAASSATAATGATVAAVPLAGAPLPAGIVLTDPVCEMTVDPANARHLAEYNGVTYAFCAPGCRTRFVKNPARYLALA